MVAQGAEVVALGKARLEACPYHVLRSVLCEFQHGILTLRGQLPTFFHKQMMYGPRGRRRLGRRRGRLVNQIEVAAQ